MQVPTVHLNGTSGKDLLNEYVRAWNSVNDAQTAISNITVHGRDYYVQKNNPLELAQTEMFNIINSFENIKNDLFAVIENINKQMT